MEFESLHSIIRIIAHPVSVTNAISNIVKSPSRTISETSHRDSLLTTKINCVACDVGLFNYCRQNCRLHCRLWLLVVASTIVTVIIAIVGAISAVIAAISSIIILIIGAAT